MAFGFDLIFYCLFHAIFMFVHLINLFMIQTKKKEEEEKCYNLYAALSTIFSRLKIYSLLSLIDVLNVRFSIFFLWFCCCCCCSIYYLTRAAEGMHENHSLLAEKIIC